MKQKIQKILIGLSIGVSAFSTGFASQHLIKSNYNFEYVLTPNQKEEFTNFTFQTITMNCTIATDITDGHDIFIEALRKKGKINDTPISAGDTLMLHVLNKDIIKVTAESGSKVALTNLSDQVVKASCVS